MRPDDPRKFNKLCYLDFYTGYIFEWREHANYSSYYSLEPATSVEVVRSYLLDYLPFLTMNRRSYNSR
jgi:hypothetical protein